MSDYTRSPWESTGVFSPDHTEIKKNTKDFNNFSYFLGVMDVTNQNLDNFTPYIRGISRIFLHKPPIYMNARYPDETRSFKQYVESGYKTVDGIGDISVEFATFEGGFNAQSFQTPQSAKDDTESVTISLYEFSGSPVRYYTELWIGGVSDIATGVAHYHGLVAGVNGQQVKYSMKNHTAEYIYVTYDPTARTPEYSCLFANCFPRRVPKSHYNYESGNRDNVQMDLEYATKKYESPAINDIAWWYTMNSTVDWNYLAFNPEKGTGSIKDPMVETATWNYGSDGAKNVLT